MLRRIISIICVSLCSALFLAAESLPTYVVSATTEEENVLDVPASVTVITAEEILASGKTSVVELLEAVPGVTFRSFSTDAQAQVSMRGFGENSFGRVLVLVDGRELNNPDMAGLNWQSVPLSSISRIEVLDGPAAVLYGSGAVGGVINIVTKESSPGLSAGATLSYGSFDTREYRLNGGYGTDHAGFSVSADWYSTDGYRKRSAYDSRNVVLNAFVDATDKLTLKPSFTFADIAYELPGPLTKAQFGDDPTQAVNKGDSGTERDFGGSLAARLDATDALSVELPLEYLYKVRSNDTLSLSSWSDILQHRFGAKPKVTYAGAVGAAGVKIACGLDADASLFGLKGYSDAKRTVKTNDFDIAQYSVAPYLSVSASLPRAVGLSAGVRYDIAGITAEKDAAGIDASDSYSALAYEAALNLRPAESVSLYARANSLFRYPFVDEKAELLGFGDQFNAGLRPETGLNLEVGGKVRAGSLVAVSANAYFMLMDDEIACNASWHNENLDRTRRLGANLGASVTPVRFLRLEMGAGWVDAVFAAGDNEGKSIPLVPALTGNAAATFSFPFGLEFGANASYTGGSYAGGDTANAGDLIPAYALCGLTARLAPPPFAGKLAFTARVDNLLDASYAPFVFWGGYYPADGRAFTIGASYTY